MGSRCLQEMLQAAVQSVRWTYSLFWQFCPQQRGLVWGEGYYNGAIKTRKTVQPAEETAEEAAGQRSHQLRELYHSLLAAEDTKRPSTALSPEDLTESEWFYLMCASFSFPPPSGLPGKAYARKQHVWLSGANEVDCKTFSRSILAKSAKIQTVVCIPLLDGVVELGTTDKVEEDLGFIYHIKSFFNDQPPPPASKPALSEHSTSNPSSLPPTISYSEPFVDDAAGKREEEGEVDEDEDDEDEEEEEVDEDEDEDEDNDEPSKLMQVDTMSTEDLQFGSPEEVSNNLDSDFHMLAVSCSPTTAVNAVEPWPDHLNSTPLQPHPIELETTREDEDSNYSLTVSAVLQAQRSDLFSSLACVSQSSFARWKMEDAYHTTERVRNGGASQSVLKYILLSLPYLHAKPRSGSPPPRFITLRAMVPFVTKMDKVSILGDTIEYVKQLRARIQDLEVHSRIIETEKHSQKRMRPSRKNPDSSEMVEVSIIESDALLEMRCEYREGLLIDVLQVLRELRIETTAVHSAVNGGVFTAEIRAKVKDTLRGKKVTIIDVKRAIRQVLP
ncbi:PREDICTED: truncated basic helix-loop-helix protein A [Tarenaya hassleriana]|uniref:truncated basic helix-loop-helix protein A n=1 Tax=Tarenaya hassleriana TaxID=28532 RepID=UPI00053C9F1F|nr:PREDICTED: truncated basic helix-loop-helix protein A [Tarenaya hassleriana]